MKTLNVNHVYLYLLFKFFLDRCAMMLIPWVLQQHAFWASVLIFCMYVICLCMAIVMLEHLCKRNSALFHN